MSSDSFGGLNAGSIHADFTLNVSNYLSGMQQVLVATQQVAAQATQAAQSIQHSITQQTQSQNQLIHSTQTLATTTTNSFTRMGQVVQQYGRYLAAVAVYSSAGLLTKGVVQAALDYETAFTGVQKTVDDTAEGYARLSDELRDLSKELPVNVIEIAKVAEAAGQLGIAREDITEFARVALAMGVTTNVSSEEAANAMARIANIFGTSHEDFNRIGSTVVDLGNKFATTEEEIFEMSLRMAGVGNAIGLAEKDIFAISTALSSLGQYAEAGGSAFSRMMVDIQSAVSAGGGTLTKFSTVAGMTSESFANLFRQDSMRAIQAFVKGLADIQKNGGDVISTLSELGVIEVRQRTTMANLASGYDTFANALEVSKQAWQDNNALQIESEKRYATTASQLQLLKNSFYDLAITLGDYTLPALGNFAEKMSEIVETGHREGWLAFFDQLSESILPDDMVQSARDFGSVIGEFTSSLSSLGTDSRVLDRVGLENMTRLQGKIEAVTQAQNSYNAAMKEADSLWAVQQADVGLMWSADVLNNARAVTAELQKQAKTADQQLKEQALQAEFEKAMAALTKKVLTEEERALERVNALKKEGKITDEQVLALQKQVTANLAFRQQEEYQKQLFDLQVRDYDTFTRLRMEYDQQVADNAISLEQTNQLYALEAYQMSIQQMKEGFATLYTTVDDIAGALHEWGIVSEGTMETIREIQTIVTFINGVYTAITAIQGIMQALETYRTTQIVAQNTALTQQLALTQSIAAANAVGSSGGLLGGLLGGLGGIGGLGLIAAGGFAGLLGAGIYKYFKDKDKPFLTSANAQVNPLLNSSIASPTISGAYGLNASSSNSGTSYSSTNTNNSAVTMNFYSPKAIDAVEARRQMETAWREVNVRSGNRQMSSI